MPRFFVPSSQIDLDSGILHLYGEDAHHIARSLRMAVGDGITVCDMHALTYTCRLTRIRDDEAEAEILSTAPGMTDPPYLLRLFMAYPKGDKLETIIQKAVELGAARITPVESERCIKRPPADRAERITERLTRIASAAAKQCGRSRLPQLDAPLSFAAALREAAEAELPLFCYEGEGTESLRALLAPLSCPATVSVFVGAEGGFSSAEAKAAADAGFRMVNLGPRILRCETAPHYILSALSYQFELPEN